MEGSGSIKKLDLVFMGSILLLGILLLLGFRLYAASRQTGVAFAKVSYRDQLILMIDLEDFSYKIYDTEYKDEIDVGRADEGIFYVPGTSTTDMSALYATDTYARDHQIKGVKLQVESGMIEVAYQESPLNICQLQRPTDSSLEPLVCLPNELVVSVTTDMNPDEFVPDSALE